MKQKNHVNVHPIEKSLKEKRANVERMIAAHVKLLKAAEREAEQLDAKILLPALIKKFEGKYFKFRDSYGNPQQSWWEYIHVLKVKGMSGTDALCLINKFAVRKKSTVFGNDAVHMELQAMESISTTRTKEMQWIEISQQQYEGEAEMLIKSIEAELVCNKFKVKKANTSKCAPKK